MGRSKTRAQRRVESALREWEPMAMIARGEALRAPGPDLRWLVRQVWSVYLDRTGALRTRQACSGAGVAVELVDGDQRPVLRGEAGHHETAGGTRVDHPNAYHRAGGRCFYVTSSLRIEVGRDWRPRRHDLRRVAGELSDEQWASRERSRRRRLAADRRRRAMDRGARAALALALHYVREAA